MIIGLTGTNGAGKTTVADHLKQKGFAYFSLSDVLRDELKKQNIPETRENLINMGNKLRSEFGANILAKRIIKKIDLTKNTIVDSIRNAEEVKELKKLKDFIFIAVDAPIELRHKRLKERFGRKEEHKTLEQFREQEQKEFSGDKTKQQLGICMKMANKVILNGGTITELKKEVEGIIK